MKLLSGEEERIAISFMNSAVEVAKLASCQRSKCGAVIVSEGKIIGEGFNSPSGNLETQRKCENLKSEYHEKVTDKTCCVHAEQRAVINAIKNSSEKIKNSTLYFIRLDNKNNLIKSGKPYCTHCSKLALDVGIKYFLLWHEEGIMKYNTEEYNLLSFNFQN